MLRPTSRSGRPERSKSRPKPGPAAGHGTDPDGRGNVLAKRL